MGYISHNAIVVTSWKEDAIGRAAITTAARLGLEVLGPSGGAVNGYRTIIVCPDGSKEGWDDSNDGDKARDEFKKYLRSVRYDDGSSVLEWCEVRFGNDDGDAVVVDHEWKSEDPKCS